MSIDNLGTRIMHAAEREMLDGLRLAAHDVLEEAKKQIPVGDPTLDPDPAITLRDTGHVEQIETPFGPAFRVGFTAPYAAVVEFAHYKHPRGGHAHYLESALTQVMPRLDRIVATKVTGKPR